MRIHTVTPIMPPSGSVPENPSPARIAPGNAFANLLRSYTLTQTAPRRQRTGIYIILRSNIYTPKGGRAQNRHAAPPCRARRLFPGAVPPRPWADLCGQLARTEFFTTQQATRPGVFPAALPARRQTIQPGASPAAFSTSQQATRLGRSAATEPCCARRLFPGAVSLRPWADLCGQLARTEFFTTQQATRPGVHPAALPAMRRATRLGRSAAGTAPFRPQHTAHKEGACLPS